MMAPTVTPIESADQRDSLAVVALGGGHGLAAVLGALRLLTPKLTAIVTVADDGGSSGRLREELGALPPGDLRMALAALAAPDGHAADWASAFQHRFAGSGPLAGHAVGNLLLTGLMECLGDPVAALDRAASLLGAAGRVLPLACQPLDIEADVAGVDPGRPQDVSVIRGQHRVAVTTGTVLSVRLLPDNPTACPEAVAAVLAADVVVLGPGSLFTSMLPHLLVPELHEALVAAKAQRVLILNLAPQPGETSGFSPEAHLEVLAKQAPELRFDVVLADPGRVLDSRGLIGAADALGARVVLAAVADQQDPARHDPSKLAVALAGLLGGPKVRN